VGLAETAKWTILTLFFPGQPSYAHSYGGSRNERALSDPVTHTNKKEAGDIGVWPA